MKTDFYRIKDGQYVMLFPNDNNLLHSFPVKALYQSGYFYCDMSNPELGPDYYLGDVSKYCDGYREV